MKTTLMTLTLIFGSSFAFAGNGSGTLGAAASKISSSEVVKYIGEQNGVVKFHYGLLNNNQWNIQKIEIQKTDLAEDVATTEALEVSKQMNSWTEIR